MMVKMKRVYEHKLDAGGNQTKRFPAGATFDVHPALARLMVDAGAADPQEPFPTAAKERSREEIVTEAIAAGTLDVLTRAELDELAKARNVDVPRSKSKTEAIDLIKAASAP